MHGAFSNFGFLSDSFRFLTCSSIHRLLPTRVYALRAMAVTVIEHRMTIVAERVRVKNREFKVFCEAYQQIYSLEMI